MKLGMNYFTLGAGLAFFALAHAGHEFPFYPSFYPQEITVEALDAGSAAQRLANGTLHAYAGEIAAQTTPAKTASVTSLGGYVVATFERDGCRAARGMQQRLGVDAVWHPYPVTPFHADYLYHADRAAAARDAAAAQEVETNDARIEVVEPRALVGASHAPWARHGWYHAYRLLAPAAADPRIENAVQRLMRGDYRGFEERVALERHLVELLQRGCKRVVLGYTLRREHYGVDYSGGVENVGYDALEGLASPIFPRTVKLRDFPWNGWLSVAAASAPSSAWNPLGEGFGDPFGRLVWSALSDPALFPAPHGEAWIENRLRAKAHRGKTPLAVPESALLAEPGGGRLGRVGRGKTAAWRVVYHVHNSAFHDGTPMSVADLLYAYAFAAAPARERLKGVRLLRVEQQVLAFGEDKLNYEVPVIEVYVDAASERDAVAMAPPWSTLPWHLLALFEEAARRGYLVLTQFDPVRDAALVQRLDGLARELEERGHVPRMLLPYVKAEQARERYRRLREFRAAHGHWLATNGPYRLERWDGSKAVLGVFRDPSYPRGLGSFNRHAVPLKAYITRIERRASGVELHLETERLEREGRDVRIVRGRPENGPRPSCRYLLVDAAGGVAAAGEVRATPQGRCRLQLKAGKRLVVAAVLDDAAANAPLRIVPWE
jgi:hypothetical protein